MVLSCTVQCPTNIIASDFDWLIWYPESSPYLLRFLAGTEEISSLICQYVIDIELDLEFYLTCILYTFNTISFFLIKAASSSIFIRKSAGLRQFPCRTPLWRWKSPNSIHSLQHFDFGFVYITPTQSTNVDWNPIAASFLHRNCQFNHIKRFLCIKTD